MKPVKKIALPQVFPLRDLNKIFKILSDKQAPHPQILMVGGVVRDLLLKQVIGDIDLATTHVPREVMKRFQAHGIKVIPTGIDHGTVTVVMGNNHYQITTLRRDVDTDGRHAKIAFTTNWVEDARRRDFTINTLLMDIDGHIYDPLGVGVKDISVAKVRFVGDPNTRIREDYLRALRFYRFHARFDGKRVPPKTQAALEAQRTGLTTLSRERIADELMKLLRCKNAVNACQKMKRDKMLPSLFARDIEGLDDNFFLKIAKIIPDDVLMIVKRSLLLNLTSRYVVVSNDVMRSWEHVRKAARQCKSLDTRTLRTLYYFYDQHVAIAAICVAAQRNGWEMKNLSRAVKYLERVSRPVFPWRGQDLLDLGYAPGPQIKNALKKLERVWIKEGLK
jgi:poly(A) polymerase